MILIRIIIGVGLVSVCFALMAWGQKYLGEKRCGKACDSCARDCGDRKSDAKGPSAE